MATKPIGIYHEHPDWFRPLFQELDRRGTHYERIDAAYHRFDPSSDEDTRFSLVFNRMSPSAYLRGRSHNILYTQHYLGHLEQLGVRVINGATAFRNETSKALQLSLLRSLGLPFPAARVINHPTQAPAAAQGLRFPIVVKANIGGSGAGIVRFDTPQDLRRAVDEGRVSLGIDETALVQEYVPARGGHITRVEVLNGKYLYAINVYSTGESFNLCPADICQSTDGVELARGACPVDAPKNNLRVEGYRASSRGDCRSGADHGRRACRDRRHRVHDRRSRRAAVLLRYQRAVELRGRCAAGDRLRSVRAPGRLARRRSRQGREASHDRVGSGDDRLIM